MQSRRGESGVSRHLQEIRLDGSLAAAIIAERLSRRIFPRWYLHAVTVYPDGPAMEEVLHPSAQGIHQLAGAFHGVAGQIDHRLGPKLRDLFPERSGGFFGRTIELNPGDLLPRFVWTVGLTAAPRDADHLVPGLDQPWREVGSDMSATTDNDDSHRRVAPASNG